jgi:DNA-binding response OmpR family regulator
MVMDDTAQPEEKKIIIVEDNASLAEIYKTRLELIGYTCFVAYNGVTALYFIQKEQPDLVLLDLMIPDLSGVQVLGTMRACDWGKNIPVYVVSNLNESDADPRLRSLGIAGYSVKATMVDDTIDKIVDSILRPAASQSNKSDNGADGAAAPAIANEPSV